MLTMERIMLLKQVSFFSGLHIHELRLIADITEETEADGGETIFNAGEPGDSMYVVLSGKVDIFLASAAPFRAFGPFEAFGEMSLLDDEPRSATARALEPSKLIRIEREKFLSLLAQYPVIAVGLLRVMARRIRAENQAPPAADTSSAGTGFR